MSSGIEFTGRTVARAVENACQKLDIKEESIEYDVVTKGSTGIFGIIGAKKAVIKVNVSEKQVDSRSGNTEQATASATLEDTRQATGRLTEATLAGQEALERIADGITAGARVHARDYGKRVSYEITGGRAGILIGKRGQTLEAIQYLVEKVVNRNSKERVRVSIDVGGYLAQKRQNLENLAERTAQKARKNGKPVTIGQLNAHDRRIIHIALKDSDDVITKSVGNGFLRKLVVLPKKRHNSRKRRP